jgi:putative protease
MGYPDSSSAVELLAPAGDWDCARAAVENGADAIYFGLNCGFNARARAKNFEVDDLPELLHFLHQRGVKGYVTLNTLVFAAELPELETLARALAASGVDAVLVQDFGAARLIRSVAPELPLHASTQMTLTSAECIRVAVALGIERVVLARELSLDEIREIRRECEMPLEVFVHGALCVAYSGQCLTSESLGGRSANRGQCAQACRLSYDLLCDGEQRDLGDQKYLLSPQDLAAYDLTPELIAAGVTSFKIEGRLKTPEYVANITRHYRRALDAAVAAQPIQFSSQEIEEMELSFSRGFSHGWLAGCDHKQLVPATSSAKRGVLLGKVLGVQRQQVRVQLKCSLAPGDGIVFAGDRERQEEQGGRVYAIIQNGRRVTRAQAGDMVALEFDRQALDLSRLYPGQQLWKTDDPQLNRRLRQSFTAADPIRKVPLDLQVVARCGEPLMVSASSPNGRSGQVSSPEPLPQAAQHPLTTDVLKEQFGRLGGTVYQLREMTTEISGQPHIPLSVLGQLRRELVRQLTAPPQLAPPAHLPAAPVLPQLLSRIERLAGEQVPAEHPPSGPQLHVLCRELRQLEPVLRLQPASVMVDFADIREYREAVAMGRQAGIPLWLATPRIQKPGELGVFRALLKQTPDGVLVRNLAGLKFFRDADVPVLADFSLNITNALSAEFVKQLGALRLTAAYDLNREQLLDLVQSVPAHWLEVVIHQHMPMFHMEHCVFCAVLSPGTNKTNCGRPCDVHRVELRDRIGSEHPLTADVGCRNTLFNAVPQSGAEAVAQLQQRGVQHFRVELLREGPREIERIIRLYRELLGGLRTGTSVWQELRASNRVGVTRGTLEERRNPLAIL